MDIVLATETENPALSLQRIRRFGDGSGYAAILAVRSAWLSISYQFIFEEPPLKTFIGALREMDKSLSGTAVLKPLWEPQSLTFESDNLGHVKVRGDLIEHGLNEQRVLFSFNTDQTCLSPLIRDLEVLQSVEVG